MAESAAMSGLNKYGFDPESEEWIDKQLELLRDALKVYKKNRNHKWIYITESKIIYYSEKKQKKNDKARHLGRYGSWNTENLEFLRRNAAVMSETRLSAEIGLSRTAIHKKKMQLGI